MFAVNTVTAQTPVANFNATTTTGCAPLIVQFNDLSTGNPNSWHWDLGNGTVSSQQNPVGTFFLPGSYNVKLVVQNANGKDSITKAAFITVFNVPTINFSGTPTSGCYPLNVAFTDASTPNAGTITSWTWDFGDGTPFSTLQNPTHTYNVAGNFGVTLIVKNSVGCSKTFNKAGYINVVGGVAADFSIGSTSGCGVPTNVSFTNASTGTGTLTYLWTFGDGGTSTQQNPTHSYNAAGAYTVTLTVTNNTGCSNSITKTNIVNIGAKAPNFSISGSCQNTPILFTNTSSPTPVGSSWSFGDGGSSTLLNAPHTYSTAASYNVKLVVDYGGGCKDSIIKPVVVTTKPTAAFSNIPIGACLAPLNVSFQSSSIGATSYVWLYGDGTSGVGSNAVHNYTAQGLYDVSLIATNGSSCSDTLVKKNAVRIAPPNIDSLLQGAPYSGCAPYTHIFEAAITSGEAIATYEWDFGDGTGITTGATPTHTYQNVGSYTIKLIVTTINGCKDTLIATNKVVLSSKPTANFSATPRNACAKDDIKFSDLSTGNVSDWEWSFGDGGSSNAQNPTYNYTDTGFFTVMLVVKNGGCADTLKLSKYIYINPPIARFTKIASCDTPFQRRFQDQSIGATTYNWTFGDGGTSTLANPVHTYATTGFYFVELTVSNGICTHNRKDSVYINTSNPILQANGGTFCKYAKVSYLVTNIDTALVANYTWYFGDGSTQSGKGLGAIQHAYSQSGVISPSVVITDLNGCIDSIGLTLPITIYGPKAGFYNDPGTCINGTIHFTDTSTTDGIHPIQQWIWSYGDSKIDTFSNPPFAHQYLQSGVFDVKLTIKDSYGCYDTLFKQGAVLITKPIAAFASPDTIRCKNTSVQFNNTSQGVALTYVWNFGDNATSTNISPSHPYADTGYYTIKLIIKDVFGCTDTLIKPKYIYVQNSKANFKFLQGDTLGLCYPYTIQVASTSNYTASLNWSFGDGSFSNLDTVSHIYNYVGNYPLTLYAYGFGGCVDSAKKNITVRGPIGSFSYTPLKFCAPTPVSFKAHTKNNASFIWDFSDGTILPSTDSVVSHVYVTPGLYKPKMILIDASGCQVLIVGTDTVTVADVKTKIKTPITSFCDSVRLQLLDSTIVSNDNISTYAWNFGDGGLSAQQNPIHLYTTPGTYLVSLQVTTTLGCKHTDTLVTPIKIHQTPEIKVTGDSIGCVNAPMIFKGVVVKSDTAAILWKWTFSNGNNAIVQNPPVQYFTSAGTFIQTAIAYNAFGCSDTLQRQILVHPSPIVDAGKDSSICKGNSITLQPTGASNYVWSMASTLSCSACINPVAKPDSLTKYSVVGYNSFGCSAADSVYVDVIQPFKVKVSKADTLCIGESAQLIATGGLVYNWSPTTGLNNPTINNPVATPPAAGDYYYFVTAQDDKKCFTDTASVHIKVYPYPSFDIKDAIIKANVGTVVPISTSNSSDITKWKWLPDKYLTCTSCPSPGAIITENIKYVAEATNAGGCKTKDEVIIETLCDGGNFFIPNTFSPNGDGVNEKFYVRGKGLVRVKTVRVFNRWGELVFAKENVTPNDETSGWDGSYKGTPLSPDVYVYIIEIICSNNTILPIKGNIMLIK